MNSPTTTDPGLEPGAEGHTSILESLAEKFQRMVTGKCEGGAFGHPGTEPRWSRSSKQAVGTAYHTSCQVWFTISEGIINEVYYPHVDRPNTRDLQFLVTDGESFCHDEKSDLDHLIEYPEKNSLLCRITNSDRQGRYRIIKEVICDPHHSVLLVHTKVEILVQSLRGKLRVFALLAPHLNRAGAHNTATVCDYGGRSLFHIFRADAAEDSNSADLHLAFGAQPDFIRRSAGYVGASDGWQDLQDFQMDWEFARAEDGNIAVTGECDLSDGGEFTLAIGFGRSRRGGATKVLQAFAVPFAGHRKSFVADWRGICEGEDYSSFTGDCGSLFRLSRCLLHAHEDKVFCGAIVASMSIPWGETKGDHEIGGYHLVWPRDLVQNCIGLLATGHTDAPKRALIWLACLQDEDGGLAQNSWIDGEPFWKGSQLDEVAAPVLLAWHLHRLGSLGDFDPWTLLSRAARFLITHGPVTMQDRWEENSGYSPGTLATGIAALVIVAEFARLKGDDTAEDFALAYADWLESHLEEWTVTSCGDLVREKPRHFIRITPADASDPHAVAEPDTATLKMQNGSGEHPARNVVSLEFLQLVRLGIRDAHDPLVVDSVAVVDAVIRYDLPQGPGWRRYNHDCYGQKEDGSAFDGTGVGGCWPLLTGERAHYELAAGRDVKALIHTMERFSNDGGMLPEQVWFSDEIEHYRPGEPTGSAMPLCWAHAEYMTLVRSAADNSVFDRIEPVYDRYVRKRPDLSSTNYEMWTPSYRVDSIQRGKFLRVIVPSSAIVRWSDGNGREGEALGINSGLGCWFADLPFNSMEAETQVSFQIQSTDTNDISESYRVTIV